MSVYTNQTNITPGTSAYITRNEVITAFSTIAGDLSGVNWSTILYNANPVVSSLTVNGSGLIQGASGLQVNNTLTVSSATLRYGKPTGFNPLLCVADQFGNFNNLGTGGIFASAGGITGGSFKTGFGTSNIYGQNGAGTNFNLGLFDPSNLSNPWSLTNVSTINGIPPNTGGTTFTNLTGSNLTTTGTLTSPQIVSVSSINGAQYANAYQATFTGSNQPAIPTGVATSVFSITTPPGTLKPNEAFIYDVPIVLGNIPPSPINFQLLIGVRLGGNGQINYSLPYWIASNSVFPVALNLTGIANTNQTALSTNNIDIIFLHNSGLSWTIPVYAPPSAGGVNTWTLKLLD